jgi:hypothetical protein
MTRTTIRQIVWNKTWEIIRRYSREIQTKVATLTTDQEKQIEALDRYICSALDIDREEFPDPDGG